MTAPVTKLKTVSSVPDVHKGAIMHVLYVDDEVGLLETTKKILELIGPFRVETVSSVDEAMKKLEETEFDVIVSDYQLPEKDGLEFLRELRENGNSIPLILFTGKGREEIAIKALNLGADFYINKIGRPDTVYNQLSHSIAQAAKKREAEKRLKYKVNFESVIARISSRFVNPIDLDTAINEFLEDMGEISAASRVYIFLLRKNGTEMDNTHEWCMSGITPQIENLKNIPVELVPWWMSQLYDGKTIHIPDVSLMPSEAESERVLLENQNVKSAIVLPINVAGELAGFIGFDNVQKTGAWSSDDVALLQIVSELIGTTLERKQSEGRYRTIFENTGTAMCILEDDKTISVVNREFEELSGYSKEEVEGKKWTCFVTETCLEQMQRYHEARRKMGKKPPKHYSFEFINKLGQIRKALLTIEMIPGTKQSVASILDITEHKKAEKLLKSAGETFQTYFDLAQVMLLTINLEGNITHINKKGCQVLGYAPEEIVGKNWFNNFLPKRFRTKTKAYFTKMLTGKIDPVEYHENPILTKNGKQRLIVWHNTLLRDEHGNVTGTLSSGEDITEIRNTEKRLRKSEDRFKAIFNGSSDGILGADLVTKKFVFANPTMCNLTGYSLKELRRLRVDDVHPKECLVHVVDLFSQQTHGKITSAKNIPILRKDKHVVYCDINSRLIKIGKKEFLFGFFREVTERKKAEDARDILVKELEKVIEKLKVVGKATRHDVRNKLAVVANDIYLAKHHLTGEDCASEYLNASELTIRTINKILDFASTYEMIGLEEQSYIDAGASVKEAVALFSGFGDIKLVNECGGLVVLADSELRQLFYNLVDNSMVHGEKVTEIRVYYKEEDDLLKLIYEDNGVGIPEHEKELIFHEGYGKGTGYGLYLIQKMCESYGWTIQETGTYGKGAQFTITVPRKDMGWKTSRQLK